ncbi:lipid A deacylase LpxR family protein [Alcanivorax sp. S6407]|uniref:lipid A deacylase LpxR family protein n=1 Tax=Alcanivorax sp. S6407 TaxID=2926424 RepID=UPI001FF2A290|nr:lipid A deacylase LpxR family protein [Alcanivorax sp. S6407]MCK0154563.1 lipid A deacylase LpxR family protein [Alcanivorax sp. S6407]
MRACLVLFLFAWLCSVSSASTLGFAWDNDLFVGEDGRYTNGVRFSWVGNAHEGCDDSSDRGLTCGLARATTFLPGVHLNDQKHALAVGLEQTMVTPSDITRSAPDYADVPYVGYSNLELGMFSWNREHLVGYGIRVGVTGPDSGAEQSQKVIHKITGSEEPRGWDNQLGPDVIGGLIAVFANRLFRHDHANGLQTDMGYSAMLDANNFLGTAGISSFVRFGKNLPNNFTPDYAGVGTSSSQVGLFDHNGTGWEIFLGASAEYIGYFYLEEETDLYDLETRDGIFGLVVGSGLHLDNFSFTLTLQGSQSPLRNNDDVLSFGNMSFMWKI